jgi:hypothetical protein
MDLVLERYSNRLSPHSSSASRFTAGASGFLNFSESGRAIARSWTLRDNPFQSHLAGVLEDRQAAVVLQMLVQPHTAPALP